MTNNKQTSQNENIVLWSAARMKQGVNLCEIYQGTNNLAKKHI